MAVVKIVARHTESLISRIVENDLTGDSGSLPLWIGWPVGLKQQRGASESACQSSSRNILTYGTAPLTLREDFGDPNSCGFKVMTELATNSCISAAVTSRL